MQSLCIHRCYVIWGSDWRAVALPLVSYACTMVGGFLDILPLPPAAARGALTVAYGGVFLTNVLSSTLAAGRIWFMSRSFARLLGTKRRTRYTELTAIILESGLIYPFLFIITIVIISSRRASRSKKLDELLISARASPQRSSSSESV
uniref:Uncharacterized protein n=1 Tax=Mycena chlorophos TaxID=658473 RepID=A0ABQ0LXU9_MYCCL|nr:predicted protein [Mycena chlorophos]